MSKKSKKKARKAEFSDDSSSALGLSHRSRVHRPVDAVIAVRERDLSPATQAIRDFSRRVDALVREGYTALDASTIASAEASEESIRIGAGLSPREPDPSEDLTPDELARKREKDYLGASIASLMGGRSSTHHGGKSAKGRNKTPKKGTWVCKECHLEYCEHRPGSHICRTCHQLRRTCGCRGARRELVGARVSKPIQDALHQSEMSAGEILEAVVGVALRSGMRPAQAVEMLENIAKQSERNPAA